VEILLRKISTLSYEPILSNLQFPSPKIQSRSWSTFFYRPCLRHSPTPTQSPNPAKVLAGKSIGHAYGMDQFLEIPHFSWSPYSHVVTTDSLASRFNGWKKWLRTSLGVSGLSFGICNSLPQKFYPEACQLLRKQKKFLEVVSVLQKCPKKRYFFAIEQKE